MLLKALLTRLGGGAVSTPDDGGSICRRFSRLVYEKYPILSDLILKLFCKRSALKNSLTFTPITSDDSQAIHMTYPAMEIIERFGVPKAEQGPVKNLLFRLLDSHIWHLREKAAKILASFTDEREIIRKIQEVAGNVPISQNPLHGLFLCWKFMNQQRSNERLGKWLRRAG